MPYRRTEARSAGAARDQLAYWGFWRSLSALEALGGPGVFPHALMGAVESVELLVKPQQV